MGRERIDAAVLKGLHAKATHKNLGVPPLDELLRSAKVRFIDRYGKVVEPQRVLITWED